MSKNDPLHLEEKTEKKTEKRTLYSSFLISFGSLTASTTLTDHVPSLLFKYRLNSPLSPLQKLFLILSCISMS
jgi:hypothetical protein